MKEAKNVYKLCQAELMTQLREGEACARKKPDGNNAGLGGGWRVASPNCRGGTLITRVLHVQPTGQGPQLYAPDLKPQRDTI